MWPKKLEKMPAIKQVMTPFPYSVEPTERLERAQNLMSAREIHHLPVMERGAPVGVISHRDLHLALDRLQADEASLPVVGDVPRDEAFVVDLSEPLDRVLIEMANKRLGAALVVKQGRLAGIFTLTDACRCLAESLRQQFPTAGGSDAA